MKHIFLALLMLALMQSAKAQTKTVDYYIHLVAWGGSIGFTARYLSVETAEESGPADSLLNDIHLKVLLKRSTLLDALNYISLKGWKLVTVTSVPYGSDGDVTTRCYYLLRKEIVVR